MMFMKVLVTVLSVVAYAVTSEAQLVEKKALSLAAAKKIAAIVSVRLEWSSSNSLIRVFGPISGARYGLPFCALAGQLVGNAPRSCVTHFC